MSRDRERIAALSSDDAQLVDNVLSDTATPEHTRRTLLRRAAVGAAGATAAGALLSPASAFAAGDTPKTVGVTAVTAEALAVTYLTQVLKVAPSNTPKAVAGIITAARSEEQLHFNVLHGAGFKPLTTKFWIPDAFFAGGLKGIAATIEAAETLFVNAYLVGITTFAKAGNPTLARYAGEILGVEAEHRALARDLQGKLPNNLAFEAYQLHTTAQHVKALEKLGVGFGAKGSAKGQFFTYAAVSTHGVDGRSPS
jgi:hypothetical protein